MKSNFVNSRIEKELIDVVDMEIELSDDEIKNLLEKPDWRFECHANMKHINHITIKKKTEKSVN